MTILIALGLVIAFFFLPIEVICAAIGAAIAGLPGAIVGVIIGFFIDIASA
jgi:hypothetical protein